MAAEKAGFSEVVTTGLACRILNPRSLDWELKDRCDYSSDILKRHPWVPFFAFVVGGAVSTKLGRVDAEVADDDPPFWMHQLIL